MSIEEQAFLERIMADNSKLRCENHRLRIFLKALNDPEGYGHAVSAEVRKAASALVMQGGRDE